MLFDATLMPPKLSICFALYKKVFYVVTGKPLVPPTPGYARPNWSCPMADPTSRYFAPFKIFGFVVLILIALAIVYAAVISFKNWSGISV